MRKFVVSYPVLIVLALTSGLLAGSTSAANHSRPFRIGALTLSWGPTPSFVGLRDALVELGYREGEDFVLGVRFTQGDLAALAFAARQLVAFGTDLIIADSDDPTKAAQQATTEIPIVFLSVSDPLGLGTIESFAKPGKNVTGVTDMELKLGAKRLQVFHELIPGLRRVLFPYHATEAYALGMAAVYRDAARRLGIELIETLV